MKEQVKVKDALECYESAINVYSDYELPHLKIGELLKKLGREPQANQFFKKANIISENLKSLNNARNQIFINFQNNQTNSILIMINIKSKELIHEAYETASGRQADNS